MNRHPKVSILIPTFQQANVISIAVASALAQDYPELEVVVSDDGSEDGTELIMKNFEADPRLKYYHHAVNVGRVANYRRALYQFATGEWVVNLDGDDHFSDPFFVSNAVQHIVESGSEEIVFLQAGHTLETPEGKFIRQDIPGISGTYELIEGKKYFLDFNHFSHLATLFNREKAMALDFYRYDILSTDIESFLRLALHGKVILIKKSVGVWVQHGSNQSKRLTPEVVEKNMLRIEGPFLYASSMNIYSENQLLKWRNKLTKAYVLHYLVKSLKNKNVLKGYFYHLLKYHPQVVFSSVVPKALVKALITQDGR